MRKIFCVMLSCLLVIMGASGAFAVVYGQAGWEFEGITEDTAWEIDSEEVLKKVRDDINSGKMNYVGYYILTEDLDITDESDWEPIGKNDSYPFKSHFDGNGHKIRININKRSTNEDLTDQYLGVFGVITDNATLKNLSVMGDISDTLIGQQANCYAGGIVAVMRKASIEECNFDGNIKLSSVYKDCSAGGIAGYIGENQPGNILKCKVGLNFPTSIRAQSGSSSGYEGGIVGYITHGNNWGVPLKIQNNTIKITLGGACNHSGAEFGILVSRYPYNYDISGNTVLDADEPYPEPEPEPEPDPDPDPTNFEMTSDFSDSCAVKADYTGTAKLTGGTEPYTWEFEGELPPGLKLKISGATATITGKPTQTGDYSFKITGSDNNGGSAEQTIDFSVTTPKISTALSDGVIKKSYSKTLKATGGTEPYTWTKSSGTLPTGLKLGKTTGKISGTPTEAGDFTFKIKVTDANGATATKSYTVTITKPEITGTLSTGTVGKSYSKTLKAAGGTASYTWTKSSGTLPSGLKLGKTTGKISGTPTKAGKFTFKIKITDANGATATKSYTVTIKAASSSSANAYMDVSESLSESLSGSEPEYIKDENAITEGKETLSLTDRSTAQGMKAEAETHVNFAAELQVVSDDVISHGTDRDEDLVSVKANQPVRFIIGTWPRTVSGERVYIDDEPAEGIKIQEGTFTLPAELVHDNFKIIVKAEAEDSELESRELYISAE